MFVLGINTGRTWHSDQLYCIILL